jgi:hypothetical protein
LAGIGLGEKKTKASGGKNTTAFGGKNTVIIVNAKNTETAEILL